MKHVFRNTLTLVLGIVLLISFGSTINAATLYTGKQVDGIVMLPADELVAQFEGAYITYYENQIWVQKPNKNEKETFISFEYGSNEAFYSTPAEKKNVELPVLIQEDKLVPLQFLTEALGGTYQWVSEKDTAIITNNTNEKIYIKVENPNSSVPKSGFEAIIAKIQEAAEKYHSEVSLNGGLIKVETGKEYDYYAGFTKTTADFKISGLDKLEQTNAFSITFNHWVGTSSANMRQYYADMHNMIRVVLESAGVPVKQQLLQDLANTYDLNLPTTTKRKYGNWEVTIIPNQEVDATSVTTFNYGHEIQVKKLSNNNTSANKSPKVTPANVKVFLNGKTMQMSQQPVIMNGFTLVPLRVIFEGLQSEVKWDKTTQTVTANKGSETIKLVVNSQTAYKNGKSLHIDAPPIVINGTTMVPVRFVSQSLGANINWDEKNRTIKINQK